MGHLKNKLNKLIESVEWALDTKIGRKGIDTGYTTEKGLEVKGDFYVDGRRVKFITNEVLVSVDGFHYNHSCLVLDELIELIENL